MLPLKIAKQQLKIQGKPQNQTNRVSDCIHNQFLALQQNHHNDQIASDSITVLDLLKWECILESARQTSQKHCPFK